MADIRIKDLATTASTTASDDFLAVDGTTNGTRKLSAATPSFATSVTVPGVVGPTSTDLTLTGGSTGASLVLGQGATAGAATLTATGTGTVVAATAAASRTAFDISNTSTGPTKNGFRILGANASNADSRQWSFTANDFAYGDLSIRQSSAAATDPISGTSALYISAARNLLIGTTTDAASLAGGLVVNGSGAGAAASSTTTGALRVTGGVGVSGAGYFGGAVVLLPSSGTSRGRINNDPGRADVFNVGVNWNGASQDDNTKPSWFAQIDGRAAGDSYSIQRAAPAGAPTAILSASAAGVINIPSTTSASSSTVGALTIGNGTAATNVAIGGGNVNAGGTGTFGGAVSIGNTVGTAAAVASTHKVTMVIGGVTYYLLATNV